MSAVGAGIVRCIVLYVRFLVPVVALLLVIYRFGRLPHEVFRKLLHMVAFSSAPLMLHVASDWSVVVATLVIVGFAIWPLLFFAERFSWYEGLFVQRRTHEVRRSMLLLFWGDALVVGVCAGFFGRPDIAVASILMWGFGDAAAALVGKRYGRHKVSLPLADHKKTWEGSSALFCVALGIGAFVLGLSPAIVVAALAGAYVELITHKGYDTITVPIAVAAVLLLLA